MDTRNEIVVGVDGSPGSRAAVTWAAHAASRLHAVLAITTAVDLYDGVWTQSSALRADLRQLARPLHDAARATAAAAEPGLAVRSEALVGSPRSALPTASAHARMLVVGRTGRGTVQRAILGTTPSRLAARTSCPLVVVPPESTWPPQRVVAAVGSLPADRAVLDWARSAAAELGATPASVHVSRGPEDEVPELAGCSILRGDRVEAITEFCAPGDLLVLGGVRDRIPMAREPQFRRILASARCAVAVVPIESRAHAHADLTTALMSEVAHPAR